MYHFPQSQGEVAHVRTVISARLLLFFSPRDIFAIFFIVPFLASLYAFHMEGGKSRILAGKGLLILGACRTRVFLDRGDVLGRKDSRRQQTWALY